MSQATLHISLPAVAASVAEDAGPANDEVPQSHAADSENSSPVSGKGPL